MARKYEDLTGKQFGRWTVLEEAEPRKDTSGHLRRWWLCECSCEKHTRRIVSGASLRKGHSESCGCLQTEHAIAAMSEAKKKNNTFEVCDGYVKGFDDSGNCFFIDIQDLEKIKENYWYRVRINDRNDDPTYYFYTHNWYDGKDHKLSMQEYLTNEKYVDHINHDGTDNRRCNLRTGNALIGSNQSHNNINHKLGRNNTSGYKGVIYLKDNDKWVAQIGINYKTIHLGTFNTKEEAIQARKEGEEKYYKGWSLSSSNKIAELNKI